MSASSLITTATKILRPGLRSFFLEQYKKVAAAVVFTRQLVNRGVYRREACPESWRKWPKNKRVDKSDAGLLILKQMKYSDQALCHVH